MFNQYKHQEFEIQINNLKSLNSVILMTESESPSKKVGVQRLNDQNAQLREQLTQIQQQKFEIQKLVKKQQAQLKVFEIKYTAIENELQKQRTQNHRFVSAYEKEKKQRLELINNQQSVLNNLNRDEVQLLKLNNQNKVLRQQIETLEKNFQNEKQERVSAIRQKQNNTNKIKLLETKLQAATMEAKYSKISHQQSEAQSKRLKQTLADLQKQLAESQGPLQVQTIYRDSSSTTQKLLKQFEEKMKEKEGQMIRQIQNYEKKNSALTLKVVELETELFGLKH